MDEFSYTVTPQLKETISQIDYARSQILQVLVSPLDEQRLRYEASNNRVYFTLLNSDFKVSKEHIVSYMEPTRRRGINAAEKLAVKYKRVFNYLYLDWYVSSESLDANTLIRLENMFTHPRLAMERESLTHMLKFMQMASDHPVIQAAISLILLCLNPPFNGESEHMSHVVPMLILYKHGYYLRGLLNIEEPRNHDRLYFEQLLKESRATRNYTVFLEYFARSLLQQSERTYLKFKNRTFETSYSQEFFKLTERQKMILEAFDKPGMRITNKKVQEVYRVSQITASRDLARLAELDLLTSMGKGRAVYYIKT